MKKVVRMEDYYQDREEESKDKPNKKKRILKGLKRLVIVALIAAGAFYGYQYYEQEQARKAYRQLVMEQDAIIGRVQVGNKILEVASPDLREVNGELVWSAPVGFVRDETGLCYRILQVSGTEDEPLDKEYVAPEGMILVGDKAVDVIDPDIELIDGKEVRTCPEGYTLVGVIGVKIVDAIEVEPTLGR